MDDLEAFHRALRQYREFSGDEREFADLPADVQESIVHNANVLKKRAEEEKRG